MAVDFPSDEQARGFGGFPDEVSAEDLERFCGLDDADLTVVGRRRGMHNRLGFAVQLIKVRVAGRFLTDPLAVPWPVVESLPGQPGIADASLLKLYAQLPQPCYEHPAEISTVYGYADFSDPARYEELRLFLEAQAWTSPEGPVRLFERAEPLLGRFSSPGAPYAVSTCESVYSSWRWSRCRLCGTLFQGNCFIWGSVVYFRI